VRIDFCDADVRDVFDEWRRALGLAMNDAASDLLTQTKRGPSLTAHVERAVLKLRSARASGALAASSAGIAAIDDVIDRLSGELDRARQAAGGLRGEARAAMIGRLAELDAELLAAARATLDDSSRRGLEGEADEELSEFRGRLAPDAYHRARDAAIDRLARERLGLPALTYS
jgi:hypothetical protein